MSQLQNVFTNIVHHFKAVRYRWWVLLHDLLVIGAAWIGAYWLRFNMLGEIPGVFLEQARHLLPFVLVIQGISLVASGAHRGVWRFTSLPDLTRILRGVLAGTLLIAAVIFLYTRLELVPRSVFAFYGFITIAILCSSRIAYRLIKDRQFHPRVSGKAIIVGAGVAGEQVVRDLNRNPDRTHEAIAFVDDDPSKTGKDVQGIRVAGGCEELPVLCERWNVDLILIAVPSATDRQMQRIVSVCEGAGVTFRTLPSVSDVVSGHVGVQDVRQVRIDDLLGRDPVHLDWRRIEAQLAGKRIMVTGAGGSIGSELCRQLARIRPGALVLFERNEFNLYTIKRELKEQFRSIPVHVVLGDVCDRVAAANAFEGLSPDIVFHAAAYKHVPMLEGQPREVVRNNVLGTVNVARLAHEYACEAFVLISTDKAVKPASLMGASKRVAEIYCQALDKRSGSRFITVRFGNVLGSAGSVVPLFEEQIKRGGPVTVTHQDMTRYFMTISEATQLIMESCAVGGGGEIFILDMGNPIKVSFLAEEMIKLSGMVPGDGIRITFTGLRPGEKLHEELFYPDEISRKTSHDKINLAEGPEIDWKVVSPIIDRIDGAVDRYNIVEIGNLVCHLVPGYAYDVPLKDAPKSIQVS
ncbi:MAG: UDP-N-acetyl-alpha-D-glucosamine C6 dehydratase [Gammaproteobacteria bacterium]|nr:UDP-N-acetyl-alpha-D-glucosamine C6 dehydratase [Gammaproteobacteria bacterium]